MKIVSLLPSATEIVFALGLGDQLEAVTYECDYPPEARSKSVVCETALPQDRPMSAREIDDFVATSMDRRDPIYRLDRGLIQRIQPDLILAQDLCRVCAIPSGQVNEALSELGCTSQVLSLDPRTIDDILTGVLEVGRATGADRVAADLVAELRRRVHRVRSRAAGLPPVPTVCLEWSDPPFVAGHWIPGMVSDAGGGNLLNPPEAPSRRVRWKEVVGAAPDVVVFMPCGYTLADAVTEGRDLFEMDAFAETPAARTGAVFAVDATSFFSRPGPRIVDGLEVLAWSIHPEAFPEPPADRIVRLRR